MTLEHGIMTGNLRVYGDHQVVSATVYRIHRENPNCFADQGLWFAEGDLFSARFYSQLLALQIKVRNMGLLSPRGDSYFSSVAFHGHSELEVTKKLS